MAASRQSYEEQDIAAALRTKYPDSLYAGRHGSHVATVDDSQENYMVGNGLAADEEEQIAEVMRSWAGRPRDSWTFDQHEVVRHHVNPGTSLFSPA